MNGSITIFKGSSRTREKTIKTTCSRYTSCIIHGLEFTCKILFFPIKQLEKEAYTIKRPMYADISRPCMDSNNLMQSILYTVESWWKPSMT
jgi:hypothetical protein